MPPVIFKILPGRLLSKLHLKDPVKVTGAVHADKIADAGVSGVAISIDSLTPKFHDNFRGIKGAHSKALEGLEACIETGRFKEIIMAYTLTNKTFEDRKMRRRVQ